jgi:hypothetical protein
MGFSLYSHACLSFYIASTADLNLRSNSLMGTIPSQIALMSNLGESECCFVACCNDCVVMCFSLYSHACLSYSFYSSVVSLGQ